MARLAGLSFFVARIGVSRTADPLRRAQGRLSTSLRFGRDDKWESNEQETAGPSLRFAQGRDDHTGLHIWIAPRMLDMF